MSFPLEQNPRITKLHTFFRKTRTADYRFPGESHDFWELVCVEEGRVGITAGEQIFELEPGQAFLHPPMQFHSIYSTGSSCPTYYIFTFAGGDIPDFEDCVCRIPDLSRVKSLYELGRKTFYVHHGWIQRLMEDAPNPLLFTKQLEFLLLQLSQKEQPRNRTQSAQNYATIMQAIHQNLHRRLTVPELAALCNMSEINLQKTFSRYAGVGVMEYFSRIKMQRAIELLRQGLSVKETALQLGYKDQNYFSTSFKRITGQSPSVYK